MIIHASPERRPLSSGGAAASACAPGASGLTGLLDEARLALQQLRAISAVYSGQGRLTRPFQYWEAVASARIAGARASLLDLLYVEGEPGRFMPDPDVRLLSNQLAVLELGQSLSAYEGLDASLIHHLNHFLLTGRLASLASSLDAPRTAWGPGGVLWQRVRSATEPSLLLRAGLLHQQMVAARPFADGNGRLARLLATLLLSEQGAAPQPFLCLSPFLERHGEEYRDHLRRGAEEGDQEAWLRFFLRAVRQQALEGHQRAQALLHLQARYRELAMSLGKGARTAVKILGHLLEIPLITAQTLQEKGGMSAPTAQKAIAFWVEAGVLREISGYRRGRVYLAQELFVLAENGWTSSYGTSPEKQGSGSGDGEVHFHRGMAPLAQIQAGPGIAVPLNPCHMVSINVLDDPSITRGHP